MGNSEPKDRNGQPNEPRNEAFSVDKNRKVTLLTVFTCLIVLAIYVWLISCGLWTTWPPTTTYYDQLATAFSHGSLALETKPDPALLALPNPYDPSERTGIPAPTDISLYNGKFFLYFGPVPAVLTLAARIFYHDVIGDQYLVFIFVSGIFLFQSLLLIKVYKRFFPQLSPWLIPAGILVTGLICPAGWVLSLPTVYNAAITGGEFFFLAGFYAAFQALDRPAISNWGMAAAGILWIGSLGSRITQIVPIGFMCIMIIIWILRTYRRTDKGSKAISPILALGITLGVGLAVLGWYNWARFGSVFETGITYQLSGPFLQKYHQDIFSPVYIIQNIYNYLLIPPKLKNVFPFLIPVYGNIKPIISSLTLPSIYYSQEITGYLFNAPFILFALMPAVNLINTSKNQKSGSMNGGDQPFFNWFITSLLGASLLGFGFFLVFFWVAMRYFTDFIPALAVLSVIGYWQLHLNFARRPVIQFVFILIGILLIVISISSSNLIALSINSGRFREFDPVLWRQLVIHFRY